MVIKRTQLVKCIWKCFPYGKYIKQRKETVPSLEPCSLNSQCFIKKVGHTMVCREGFWTAVFHLLPCSWGKSKEFPQSSHPDPHLLETAAVFVPAPLGLAGAALTQESLDLPVWQCGCV